MADLTLKDFTLFSIMVLLLLLYIVRVVYERNRSGRAYRILYRIGGKWHKEEM